MLLGQLWKIDSDGKLTCKHKLSGKAADFKDIIFDNNVLSKGSGISGGIEIKAFLKKLEDEVGFLFSESEDTSGRRVFIGSDPSTIWTLLHNQTNQRNC